MIRIHDRVRNSNTEYTFANLKTGHYLVKVEMDGYESKEEKTFVPRGTTATVSFSLKRFPTKSISISGKVIDPNGNPLGSISVSVLGSTLSTVTKLDGTFTIQGMEKGDWKLSVSAEGLGFSTRIIDIQDLMESERRQLGEITLQYGPEPPPMGAIYVKAVGEDGNQITKAKVFVDNREVAQELPAQIGNLIAGIHEVRVEVESRYYPQTLKVGVQKNLLKRVSFELERMKGNLDISSAPQEAEIKLDGISRGTTNTLITKLIEGKHTLEISKENYITHEEQIAVERDVTLQKHVILKHIPVLAIFGRPSDAVIYLDGKQVGKTKGSVVTLNVEEPGTHKVRIEKEDYEPYSETVQLETDKVKELSVTLKYQTMLEVKSNPSEAKVYVDGEDKGRTPLKISDVSPGIHVVKVEKDGYEVWLDKEVAVAKNMKTPVEVELEKIKPIQPSAIRQSPITPHQSPTIIGKDGAEMVLISAGEFQMGDGSIDEKPVHTVYLNAFYMDVYEVTNTQFKKFIDANPQWRKDRISRQYHDGDYLKDWNGDNYPNGKGKHPVILVSWYAANAYAEWAGKRLPTEAEWEKAARGGLVGKKYPWGDNISHDYANYSGTGGRDQWWKGTAPVGSFSPNGYGLYDMAGNVKEWCLDWYDSDYYSSSPRENPSGPASG